MLFGIICIQFFCVMILLMLNHMRGLINDISTVQSSEMISDEDIRILAQWIQEKGIHKENDPNLAVLWELDDVHKEVYEQNRITAPGGFEEAGVLANEAVINKVFELKTTANGNR
jgi:hypothetical protein